MKETMIAFAFVSMTGCSYFSGLTSKSSEAECNDAIAKAGAEFCKVAAENRDKINAVSNAIKASK